MTFSGFWFKVPDELDSLLGLPPAQLKAYLVVTRAVQRDRNGGRLSVRQVAARARLNPRHAREALSKLCAAGLLAAKEQKGCTTTYTNPIIWRNGADCVPTGIQLPQAEKGNCVPTGIHPCIPTGTQDCVPTGTQHLESLECSEKSSSFEENGSTPPATTTTNSSQTEDEASAGAWYLKTETPGADWVPDDGPLGDWVERARNAMRSSRAADQDGNVTAKAVIAVVKPDRAITVECLKPFNCWDDFETWLKDTEKRGVAQRAKSPTWGLYAADARKFGESAKEQVQEAARIEAEEAERLISVSGMYAYESDGGWRQAMTDGSEDSRIRWVKNTSGRDMMTRAELKEWRARAEKALPNCPKCGNRGCHETSDFLHPDPCTCVWATVHGWRTEAA